jgi:DNA-binding GntR family transcriptional regulator
MTTEVPGYVTKTDLVAALIRELLITGELRPGEQLRQRDPAQRFGVSQTPELNREFHFTVYEYAHSPLLLSLMRLLWASHSGAASARTYQHIMGADPVKEESR